MNLTKWVVGGVVAMYAATATLDADAQRRLGGGRNLGRQSTQVQRQAAPPSQSTTPPSQPATPTQQPGTANAPAGMASAPAAGTMARTASPLRNALVGAAAGLGLMALASWLGFGEGFATMMLIALAGLLLLLVAVHFLRRSSQQEAYVGGASAPAPLPSAGALPAARAQPVARAGSAMDEFARAAAVQPTWGVPGGFDTATFLARAKEHYAGLQRAWDRGDLTQLQEFTTHEMFVALTHELRARIGSSHTEVVTLDAALLGIESFADEHVASVRFSGRLKVDGEIETFDEVWNLSKAAEGGSGWLLAGIQQLA